jgi:hypothetical protein
MSEAAERLREDLRILEAMAHDMDEYLRSQTLFWPLSPSLPRLTLGGYLMRWHRLDLLAGLLDEEERARLKATQEQFSAALVEKIVRFEQRAHEELHARIRQWSEYLKELRRPSLGAGDYYSSAVEPRVMIAALLDKLQMPPYELDRNVAEQVRIYDNMLHNHWQTGDFVWFEEWKLAYPRYHYWWLYGRPRPHG